MVGPEIIEKEAEEIADEHSQFNPNLVRVYWFPSPSNNEIHILNIEDHFPIPGATQEVDAFVFANQLKGEIVPLVIATIPPSHEKKAVLPKDWCGWDEAKVVWDGQRKKP